MDCGASGVRGIANSKDEGGEVTAGFADRDHKTISDIPNSISFVKAVSSVLKLTVLDHRVNT